MLSADTPPRFSHYRDRDGAEVDLVVERGADVVAIEIKSGATLTYASTSGLRALRADLGERFHMGIVAHLGEEAQTVDGSIVAVPLATLLGAA